MLDIWTSLFVIIVVGLAIWALYYIIRAAVRAGIVDAYEQMGLTKVPVDQRAVDLQKEREALQEERVQAIKAHEQQDAKK